MERIQSSYRPRKEFQGPRQHGRREFDESQTTQERPHFVGMRAREPARMNPRPDFILDQAALD